jgi:ABC-type Fe3+/spermidine/putrescine transport system ATPase subunit
MVLQGYALFPHMTVFDNVAFPLRLRGVRGTALRRRVEEALAIVALNHLSERRPSQLSGGQQQRVALARSFVHRPPVLLMDEPLSALDRALRQHMQTELRHIHKEVGTTLIYVTHDHDEALSLSDRMVVMNDAEIVQIGTSRDIYERPATLFVAGFIGSANLLPGRAQSVDGTSGTSINTTFGLVARGIASAPLQDGEQAVVVLRPEDALLTCTDGAAVNRVPVTPRELVYLGDRFKCMRCHQRRDRLRVLAVARSAGSSGTRARTRPVLADRQDDTRASRWLRRPAGVVRGRQRKSQVVPSWTMTIAVSLMEETSAAAAVRATALVVAAKPRSMAGNELGEQCVFAYVEDLRSSRALGVAAGVAVTAAVPGPAVHPMRIHPPTAQTTLHKPGQQVAPGTAVFGRPGRPHVLDCDEHRLTDQWRVHHHRRDHPLRDWSRPTLHHIAEVFAGPLEPAPDLLT